MTFLERAKLWGPSHTQTLNQLLRTYRAENPHELFGDAGDDFWYWAFTKGYRSDERLRRLLPAFPPEDVQLRYTGATGDHTVREAFAFYSLVRQATARHLGREVRSVLDFGCGWGRVTRLFLRDVEPGNLWGVDCMPDAIEFCTRSNRFCNFALVDPYPPSAIPDESFDLIYAYSVFSHLSEDAHMAWLKEFTRILKPRGLLIVTTRPRNFILTCAKARRAGENRFWAYGTTSSFRDTKAALAKYDRGEFVYEPVGGGDVLHPTFFGEACIPKQYVLNRWRPMLEFVTYADNRRRCLQNVIVARKQ